jgi:hypothetical protein
MTNPSPKTILLAIADTNLGALLEKSALRPAGYEVTLVAERQAAELLIRASPMRCWWGRRSKIATVWVADSLLNSTQLIHYFIANKPTETGQKSPAGRFYRLSRCPVAPTMLAAVGGQHNAAINLKNGLKWARRGAKSCAGASTVWKPCSGSAAL